MKITVKEKKKYYSINFKNINFKLLKFNFGNLTLKDIIKLPSEIELFNFFFNKRKIYKRVCDLGANVGMHSIFLSKIFHKVTAYEPLNIHYKELEKNKKINKVKNLKIERKAISLTKGFKIFNIQLSNTTASHLNGSKRSVYGKIIKKKIYCENIRHVVNNYDLIKVDIEGLEGSVLSKVNFNKNFPDFLIEIHNIKNSKMIFERFKKNIYYEIYKIKNKKIISVKKFKSMPKNTVDGTVFLKYEKKIN
jgi:FkbM family methyltransferase